MINNRAIFFAVSWSCSSASRCKVGKVRGIYPLLSLTLCCVSASGVIPILNYKIFNAVKIHAEFKLLVQKWAYSKALLASHIVHAFKSLYAINAINLHQNILQCLTDLECYIVLVGMHVYAYEAYLVSFASHQTSYFFSMQLAACPE